MQKLSPLYGEFDRFPISLIIKGRMINFHSLALKKSKFSFEAIIFKLSIRMGNELLYCETEK